MRLSELLHGAGIAALNHSDPEINGVCIDSRKVVKGDLFLALKGTYDDGSKYISDAMGRGAVAVLSEGNSHPALDGITEPGPGAEIIPFPGLRKAVGDIFNAQFRRPADGMETVGITGTNGKSTITKLVSNILQAAGRKVIALGTINYEIDGVQFPSELTTPGPDQFFGMLRNAADKGCNALVMEVSSHALSQDRVKGVTFSKAIFTNLTLDHMDYHKDFENYYQAKKVLFSDYLRAGGLAILNLDSEYGIRLQRELSCPCLTFSRGEKKADVMLIDSRLTLSGSDFAVDYRGETYRFNSKLIGNINLENLLAAVTLGFSLGLNSDIIAQGIADVVVTGRNQVFALPNGAYAIVDYAHTPDALQRVLASIKPMTPALLVCVFGCGGDRDRTKRPIMGQIAAESADRVILTSDNPRSEDPLAILGQIQAGIPNRTPTVVIADRREAIRTGLDSLKAGDCLLIAGKGHEDYQILGKVKKHFSDQEEILSWCEAYLERRQGGT
jgi:UDP-N-acetylmuramoyl-L-alanyl-D-glutamate--2,6-diaminopimelate ligase